MKKTLHSIAVVVVLLAFWHAASALHWVNPLFLPTPVEVAETLWTQVFVTGEILPDVFATLWRFLSGYAIAVVLGITLGVLMGYSRRIYSMFEFLVDFFRSIPATALFPLFLLFFGIGDEAKIAVVVWSATLIILVNTMYGVRHGSKLRLLVAQTMKTGRWMLFRKVIIPDALPHIFAGLRIALSLGLIVVIVTEMFIGTTVGLGRRIIDAQLVYRVPEMYAAIILTGILGYVLNRLFLWYERKTIHWSGR